MEESVVEMIILPTGITAFITRTDGIIEDDVGREWEDETIEVIAAWIGSDNIPIDNYDLIYEIIAHLQWYSF